MGKSIVNNYNLCSVLFFLVYFSHALEEISLRSNMALAQKRAINLLGGGDLVGDEFEDDYRKMCAQVDKMTLKLFAAVLDAS